MTGVRVTVMLDEDLVRRARKLQSKLMMRDNKGYSFSKILNMILRGELK